jgi:hypothetical protein
MRNLARRQIKHMKVAAFRSGPLRGVLSFKMARVSEKLTTSSIITLTMEAASIGQLLREYTKRNHRLLSSYTPRS